MYYYPVCKFILLCILVLLFVLLPYYSVMVLVYYGSVCKFLLLCIHVLLLCAIPF